MAITAEDLEQLVAQLHGQRTQNQADGFAIDGALQVVEQLRATLAQRATEPEPARAGQRPSPPARAARTRKKEK